MKSKFYGYYQLPKDVFDGLWENALVVLDANILLDFYRLSKSTCDDLFDVLKTLEDRIWIPYQAAHEYHQNIVNVIKFQIKQNEDALAALDTFKKYFENKRSYPFLTESLNKKTTKLTEELKVFLQEQQKELLNTIFKRSIKDEICDFFDGKIGDGFSDEQKKSFYKEADERYRSNNPPGYKDNEKNGDNKYGDYIIWCEIISKALSDNRDILFITDDVKYDWFIEINGKRIGPHPFLLNEFKKKTNREIYIYTLDSFLKYAKERKIKVKGKTIEEVKERKSRIVWDDDTLDYIRSLRNSDLSKLYTSIYHKTPQPQDRRLKYYSNKIQQQMDTVSELQKRMDAIKDPMHDWSDYLEQYFLNQKNGIIDKKDDVIEK